MGIATLRQKAPEKNRTIFTLLVNKAPLRRICEVAQIDPSHLYWKIKFLPAQCQTFVADWERRSSMGCRSAGCISRPIGKSTW